MADKKLNIKVSTTGAGKAKQEIGGLTGAISKMGKAVGVASAAFFGAKALINAFSSVIRLAGEQEQAEKKLEVALGKTSTALLDQASALQKVSTHGDEAIIAQQAFLASLKFSEDQIKTIIPVAIDLAAATGITLESAVRNTSKTFSGLAGELGELVPQLRDLTQEEMRAGEAVKVLGELFEGQAAEQADTMAFALNQAGMAVSDAAEDIGSLLSPVVIGISVSLKLAAEALQRVIGAIKGDLPEAVLKASAAFAEQSKHIKGSQEHYDASKERLKQLQQEFEAAEGKSDMFTRAIKRIALSAEDIETAKNAMQILVNSGLAVMVEKTGEADGAFQKFIQTMKDKVAANELEEKHLNKFIELHGDLAKSLGLIKKTKEEMLIDDLKSAALTGQSAMQSMKSVVRAEAMKIVAKHIASIFSNPAIIYPFNLVLAAGAGGATAMLMDKAMGAIPNKFATGADFITSGATPMLVGESGPERVSVTPLTPGMNQNGPQGITLNISAPLVDQTVIDSIIPAIQKAQRMNLA